MKAVVTVIGKDKVGIIAMASAECAKYGANIIDISQTVLKDYFAMIMLVDIDGLNTDFKGFVEGFERAGEECGVDIRVMHEDIFNSMHRI
ncbi:MAG: ACT domain-containing protein [Clostridia bacterium]|nr:ACT domain-containing protein [Clostridia bacterium]